MKKSITRICASCLVLSVLACGETSGDDSEPEATTFAELNADATAMSSQYLDDEGGVAPGASPTTSDLPDSGSSAYVGFLHGDLGTGGVVSEVTMNVSFGTDEVTGTASNFIHETDGAMDGQLTGTGNIDHSSSPTFSPLTLTLSGQLTHAGTVVDSDIALDGDFFAHNGDDVGAIAGMAEGNIGDTAIENGVFAVEK